MTKWARRTVAPDFLRKVADRIAGEAQLFEQTRRARQREYTPHAALPRQGERRLHQLTAQATSAPIGTHGQRAYLGQGAVEVDQRHTADDLPFFFGYQPIVQVLQNLFRRAGQHQPGGHFCREQGADGLDLVRIRMANDHQDQVSCRMRPNTVVNCSICASVTIRGGNRRSTRGPALIIKTPCA